MDEIIVSSFLCLSLYSFVVYIQSVGQPIIKAIKAILAFLFSSLAIVSYLNGDYDSSLFIVMVIFSLTYRRLHLTKNTQQTLLFPPPAADTNNALNAPTPPAKNTTTRLNSKRELKNIAFQYTDRRGNLTYREIGTKEFTEDFIIGYCRLRKKPTFFSPGPN